MNKTVDKVISRIDTNRYHGNKAVMFAEAATPKERQPAGHQREGRAMSSREQIRGYAAIALHQPKNALNVGAALRAAQIYGASMLTTSGKRHKATVATNTMGAQRHMPYLPGRESVFDVIPYDCTPIAIEKVDGRRVTPLHKFHHPKRGFYVFGPEDGSVSGEILDRCRDIVCIPAGCHNLAAAVNVVLYDRLAKGLSRVGPRR